MMIWFIHILLLISNVMLAEWNELENLKGIQIPFKSRVAMLKIQS